MITRKLGRPKGSIKIILPISDKQLSDMRKTYSLNALTDYLHSLGVTISRSGVDRRIREYRKEQEEKNGITS